MSISKSKNNEVADEDAGKDARELKTSSTEETAADSADAAEREKK